MNNVEKQCIIKRESLNEEYYFQSILQEAYKNNLISSNELEALQLQSIKLLSEQTEKYTGGESSSVKVETAEQLMLSIFYCVGVWLKSFSDADMSITELKDKSLGELYKSGRVLVNSKISSAEKLLEEVKQSRIKTNNQAYNDTIESGITMFFSSYDADFNAQDTPAYIDYPLSSDKMNLTGIEYIYNYLYKLFLENQFCQNFSSQNIEHLLQGYDSKYEELLVNIFQRILVNALGCILVDKNSLKLNIELKDQQYLQKKLEKLTEEQLYILLKNACKELFQQLNISNEELKEYAELGLKDVSVNLKNALDNNNLNAVFVMLKESEMEQGVEFKDGSKMDDELFRRIADEIRECRFVSDKIAIIKKSIHSIIDLVDVFQGACIFQDEFDDVFDSFGDMELALLLKMTSFDKEGIRLEDIGDQEEWQVKLMNYLNKIDSVRSGCIKELCNAICLGES